MFKNYCKNCINVFEVLELGFWLCLSNYIFYKGVYVLFCEKILVFYIFVFFFLICFYIGGEIIWNESFVVGIFYFVLFYMMYW